jgi:Cytochrome bd terminal oxidase subunit I
MNVDLARIQFAFTSVNHFFFVPVTIGLAFLTALLQTAWLTRSWCSTTAGSPSKAATTSYATRADPISGCGRATMTLQFYLHSGDETRPRRGCNCAGR